MLNDDVDDDENEDDDPLSDSIAKQVTIQRE